MDQKVKGNVIGQNDAQEGTDMAGQLEEETNGSPVKKSKRNFLKRIRG